jgi:outer membrane protein assembly factor BamA
VGLLRIYQRSPIFVEEIDINYASESISTTRVGKWLDWLRRPKRTNIDILVEVLAEPIVGEFPNFDAFRRACTTAAEDLEKLGGPDLSSIGFELRPMPNETFVEGQPLKCACSIKVPEGKRIGLGAKITAEGEAAVGETELKLSNYFGQLETITGSVSGNLGQTMFNVAMEKPIIKRPYGSRLLRLGIANAHVNNRAHSSHISDELTSWVSYVQDAHTITYEGTYRDVTIDRHATERMLDEGGVSIKSAIKYAFVKDSRDDRLIPTMGGRMRTAIEVAGLLGNARHIKLEADYNKNWSLGKNMTISVIARAGALFNLGQRTHIADRFFIGGFALPFHGFKFHGTGPRLAHDSFGGDLFWTASAHSHNHIMSTPIGELYSHAFAQAGNCVTQSDWRSLATGSNPESPIRVTSGAGLSLKTPVGFRFDVIYAVPLSQGPNDRSQKLSFGASLNFG